MDYANLNSQHQLQEQASVIVQSTSSLQKIPSSSGNYSWNPSICISNDGTDLYSSETIANSRLLPCLAANNFMTSQDLGSYSFDQARSFMNRQLPADGSPLQNIKEETSDSFSKLRINLPFEGNKSNLLSTLYKQDNHVIEPLHSNSIAQDYSTSFGAGFTSFSHVIPNISFGTAYRAGSDSSSPSFLLASHELGFNKSQALDLLSSPRTNAYRGALSSSPSTQHSSSDGLYRECNRFLRHGHDVQDSTSSPSSISNMKSGFFTEATTTRTKRRPASNLSEPKDQSHDNAEAKKFKSTSRSSNPPLKVRKEKLGDRISALHRLVAPFGKTDTASVLTEAIGYIQFLHDQVQTLSMPYMKSLQSKPSRKTQQVHGFGKDAETELKILDLRSRGLCLVPISCASYLNGFD